MQDCKDGSGLQCIKFDILTVVYAGYECNRKSFVRHLVMLYCSGCSSARGGGGGSHKARLMFFFDNPVTSLR